jgi:hypothetical protein
MAKKTKKVETQEDVLETSTNTQIESVTEKDSPKECVDGPRESLNTINIQALEKLSVKELLDLIDASLILSKKYENLAITEGREYFHLKLRYNEFYNTIVDILKNKIDEFRV